ncbi:hypothetical protein ACIBBB_02720 [Streptomyces sp. NPDC051217]|uniref:hypothetical protein n=1 Tax=Streptomyces sp. NPDC051217 TaxID=3365644 RepID=UPI0037967E31
MADTAVLVAALTGGTAVLASWVTSRGNAKAAKVQAETAVQVQQRVQVREIRRTAYLALIEQAHAMGETYWRVGDAYMQVDDEEALRARVEQIRVDLRDGFAPLMRCVRVIVLEGPQEVGESAEALLKAASTCNSSLWPVSRGEPDARQLYDEAHQVFRTRLDAFIGAAHAAMNRE